MSYHAGDWYDWKFSVYYDSMQDIGHANPDIRFLVDAYQHGLSVFSREYPVRWANTLGRLIQGDYAVPVNLMNATFDSTRGDINNSIFFWVHAAPYVPDLLRRAHGPGRILGFPLYDYVNLATATYLNRY